jgi:RNase P subunit RPR2
LVNSKVNIAIKRPFCSDCKKLLERGERHYNLDSRK